jgi:hypothetical protein
VNRSDAYADEAATIARQGARVSNYGAGLAKPINHAVPNCAV